MSERDPTLMAELPRRGAGRTAPTPTRDLGDLHLDLRSGRLTYRGHVVRLIGGERRFVAALMGPGGSATYEDLWSAGWPNQGAVDTAAKALIHSRARHIKKKLQEIGLEGALQNTPGSGYYLDVPTTGGGATTGRATHEPDEVRRRFQALAPDTQDALRALRLLAGLDISPVTQTLLVGTLKVTYRREDGDVLPVLRRLAAQGFLLSSPEAERVRPDPDILELAVRYPVDDDRHNCAAWPGADLGLKVALSGMRRPRHRRPSRLVDSRTPSGAPS